MNVIVVIQARMESQRLPGKIMMKIEGKPVLEHIIDFLNHSEFIDRIVIATSNLNEDDIVEQLALKLNIDCFRGDSADVLKRYFEAAKLFQGELIIRITGDNPLIDPTIVDEIIKLCKESKCEYASNMIHQTFPLGYLVEAITFPILEEIYKTKKDNLNKEHITPHLRENYQKYNSKELFADPEFTYPTWRLTLDYQEDFELIKKIYSKLYKPGSYIPYKSVIKLLKKEPELLQINEKHYLKK